MSRGDPGEHLPHGPGDTSPDRRMENLLEQLQVQTRRVRDTWQAGEAARLRVLAGQLASLAEGAGHSAIVLLAEEAEASAMCEKIEALIEQCKHAAGN
jgi:hypothetical protein